MHRGSFIRGFVAALLLAAPALADDASPTMMAVATALRAGHPQNAEAMATQMLAVPDLAPLDGADLRLNRGLAREQLGRREDALVDFTAAIDAKILPQGELARALFDRGVTLDELGRTAQAIEDYSQAVSIVPHYATALNNRANAYRRMQKFELAQADYEAALASGDDEPEFPLYGLGRIAEAQGDPTLAQSFYRKALAANAQYTPAADRMAKLALTATPANYSLRPPDIDPSVQANAPMSAPTVPVTEGDPAPQIDLHPPLQHAQPKNARRKPAKSVTQIASGFGLRPAILDSGHGVRGKGTVRIASVAPPIVHDKVSPPVSGVLIQLGAWRNEADAAGGWNHFVGRSEGLLTGLAPRIVAADIPGKGRFWRLRAQPIAGTDAASLCEQLKAKGLACIVAKS